MDALIVEDDGMARRMLEHVLAARGHKVVACGDGARALELWSERAFPLVLLDWGLPEMDGLEVCRRARKLPTGRDSVVLVLTGRTGSSELREVLAAGADDYLAKPYDLQALDVRLSVCERQVGNGEARRAAERAAQDARRLEGALLAADTVEHYLGNQLSLVLGYVELIARNPDLAADVREMADEAVEGGRKARETLEKLRRIVRLEESELAGPRFLDLDRSS